MVVPHCPRDSVDNAVLHPGQVGGSQVCVPLERSSLELARRVVQCRGSDGAEIVDAVHRGRVAVLNAMLEFESPFARVETASRIVFNSRALICQTLLAGLYSPTAHFPTHQWKGVWKLFPGKRAGTLLDSASTLLNVLSAMELTDKKFKMPCLMAGSLIGGSERLIPMESMM